MAPIVDRIDALVEEHSLLKHPFYQAWSDGRLEMGSLAGYSMEYYQLVKAVPGFMDPLVDLAPESAKADLAGNRAEEAEHVALWEKFAASIGVNPQHLLAYGGSEKTRRAVSRLAVLMGSLGTGSAAMYAFEKEIPEISRIKMEGLEEFYGITSEDATEYFRLHTEADVRHAASWRRMLEDSAENEEQMYEAATKSVWAQNLLLDTCFEQYCRN